MIKNYQYRTRVLYVDQSAQNLLNFRSRLESHFEVSLADNEEQAEQIIRENKIDIVITDNNLPNSSGVKFLQLLKLHYPDIGRILITCNKDINVLVDAIQLAGVYRFFVKPFKKSELLQIIKDFNSARKKWSREDVLERIAYS